jgi:AcrR family transcriptional regulator
MTTAPRTERRRRSDGERSRRKILDAAARLATLEGLDGLSIGRLADYIGMSKGGLYAHFDSKEDLQLATIAAAQEVLEAEVLAPAIEAPEGLPRLQSLCEGFLSYVERGVFPGGCFFASAAAEWDTRPGPVRDRLASISEGWRQLIEAQVRQAQEQGALRPDAEPAQLTFEINALLGEANGRYLLHNDRDAFGRARRGIRDRLEGAAT